MSRLKPSPAMVVAVIALIASVTSGAYAAASIANGSITNAMLADNSVWNRNIGTRSVRNININTGAVNNRTMAPNSVWNAQIGMGSVRLNNIQPATVDELRGRQGPAGPSMSAAFATTGSTPVPSGNADTALDGATDTLTIAAGENALVLNGFAIVDNTTSGATTVACYYHLGTSHVGLVSFNVPATTEVQLSVVGRGAVTAGSQAVSVVCRSSAEDVNVTNGQFTAIATG